MNEFDKKIINKIVSYLKIKYNLVVAIEERKFNYNLLLSDVSNKLFKFTIARALMYKFQYFIYSIMVEDNILSIKFKYDKWERYPIVFTFLTDDDTKNVTYSLPTDDRRFVKYEKRVYEIYREKEKVAFEDFILDNLPSHHQ